MPDVSSDQQNSGLSSNVVIDRDTASRLGLTAQAVDSALYDAFGQRQVSTMYKSINQYHVVLALQQQWWESPDFLNKIYVQTPRGTVVPLSTFTHFTQGITPHLAAPPGTVPGHHAFPSISPKASRSATPWTPSTRPNSTWACRPASPASSPARRRPSRTRSTNQPILIGTALLAVYIVLGMLYESLIHPLTIISTLPSAGVGALMALVLFKTRADDHRA